jgi:hypothetical protein
MVAVYYPRRRLSSPDTARGFQARTSDAAPGTGEALVFGYIRALMQAAATETEAARV